MWESFRGRSSKEPQRILLSDDIVDSGIGDKSLTWKLVLSKEIFSVVSHLTLGLKEAVVRDIWGRKQWENYRFVSHCELLRSYLMCSALWKTFFLKNGMNLILYGTIHADEAPSMLGRGRGFATVRGWKKESSVSSAFHTRRQRNSWLFGKCRLWGKY